jgi:hypothetical protein
MACGKKKSGPSFFFIPVVLGTRGIPSVSPWKWKCHQHQFKRGPGPGVHGTGRDGGEPQNRAAEQMVHRDAHREEAEECREARDNAARREEHPMR